MSLLFTHYETSIGLLIYAAFVWQNCLVLLIYSRPTYITVPLQKNYNVLNNDGEDDDEEIYSSQSIPQVNNNKKTNVEVDVHVTNNVSINDDDQDEEVIETFNIKNTRRQVIEPSAASTSRLESSNNTNPFGFQRDMTNYTYDNPDTLYKETTVINGNVPQENLFTFDAPSTSENSNRRAMKIIKNMILLKSVLKDIRFYVFTYVHLCLRFSILILSIAFPIYVFNHINHVEMTTMVGFLIIMYIGTICLVSLTAFTPNTYNRKVLLAIFNIIAFIGLLSKYQLIENY